MNKKGSKHLSIEQRKIIRQMLDEAASCKSIAENIGCDDRTISREVKNRRNRISNKRYGLYGTFDDSPCDVLKRFPYVCNSCKRRSACCKQFKYIYDASSAQENYEIILRDSRIGLDITLEDKEHLDKILKDGIDKKQSIHHIIATNSDNLRYSERSIYRLVDRGQTIIQPIDLKRKVKLKPRKHYVYKEDNKAIRKGRTYADFIKYISSSFQLSVTEIDTVECSREGNHKCLLTMHLTGFHLMLIFVLDSKTKENVSKVFIHLQDILGVESYKKIFPVILTDRGSEFCNPDIIEFHHKTGERLTNVFFCDSYSSYQKGAIEENHTLLRYVLPKGTLFDDLTQENADLIASHINSYHRKSIDSTPYSLSLQFFHKDILDLLNLKEISAESVTLNRSLLK